MSCFIKARFKLIPLFMPMFFMIASKFPGFIVHDAKKKSFNLRAAFKSWGDVKKCRPSILYEFISLIRTKTHSKTGPSQNRRIIGH